MRQYLIIVTLLFGVSAGVLLADTVKIQDKRSGKTIVFTDDCGDGEFQEAVNFLIDGHIREYKREEKIYLNPQVYKRVNKIRWKSYFQKYFLEKNQLQAHLIIARVDGQIVGMCAYYYVNIDSRRSGVTVLVPTLSVLGIFSECETYKPRTFMKGYSELALKKYPNAKYWLSGTDKDAPLFHEAYRLAGFKETQELRPHLNERACKKDQGFIRRIQKRKKTDRMRG